MRRTLWSVGIIVVLELLLLARVWSHAGMLGLMTLLLGSAAIGLLVVRQHGLRALTSWTSGAAPASTADEARVWQERLGLAAGLLLIVPGVLSTMAGALLLLPPVRTLVASKLRTRLPSGTPASVVMSWGARLGSRFGGEDKDRRGQVIDVDAAPKKTGPGGKRLN